MLKRLSSIILIAAICLFPVACSKNTGITENGNDEEKVYVSSHGLEMEPDLSFTLYRSDTVVKGTVLSRVSEKHTNPSGKGVNVDGDPIGNAMVTRYTFRVEESFLGDVKAGDVITLGVVNHDMIPYEYLNDPNIVVEDDDEYVLEEGQEGVFCLLYDRTLAATEEDICYLVMHNDHGVFTTEDGEHYVSAKGTEFDISELPAVIEESKAKWDEIMKNTPEI